MRFEFATATQIIFGNGTLQETRRIAPHMGNRALVVVGHSEDRAFTLLDILGSEGLTPRTFSIPEEPTIDLVQDGVAAARKVNCDLVIGFGGGSVIDAGKAIAALLTNPGDVLDYLEVIGKGQPLANPPIPYIAIPTTAGTGAEVTRNAVLTSPEHRVKVSLRSALMLPKLAIVDPTLTYSLPPEITASTGLDALTQCIEPFVTLFANPLTDSICREGIQRAARSLRAAYTNGNDPTAREDMAIASLFGGLALANAKLGAIHGFAGVLGGMYPGAPHGSICGRLLPLVVEANIAAMYEREPGNPALVRYSELAQLLTGDPTATAYEAVSWVRELSEQVKIPPLVNFGIHEADFQTIVEKTNQSSSMRGNPVNLMHKELTAILSRAC